MWETKQRTVAATEDYVVLWHVQSSYILTLAGLTDHPATRLPIYLLCDNFWLCFYAYVIRYLSGEPAYKLSIPKRWDAVLFFFHVPGVDQSPTGGLWFFLTQFTLLPLERYLPLPKKYNCCHLRQISLRHLLPLTGFAYGVKFMWWISAGSQTSCRVYTVWSHKIVPVLN